MEIIFRKAEIKDIEKYIEHRVEFIESLKGVFQDEKIFRINTKNFLEKSITNNTSIIFIAEEGGKILSSAMAVLYESLPMTYTPNGKCSIIYNVYTIAEYRNKGLAKKLLNMLLDDLHAKGVEEVLIKYTDAGKKVYEKLGFKQLQDYMILNMADIY